MWLKKFHWRAHFLFYQRKRGAEKKNIFTLKRPLQQLNRIRNTFFFVCFFLCIMFFWYFWVFMTICMNLYERPKFEFWQKKNTKVANSTLTASPVKKCKIISGKLEIKWLHIKEYFILPAILSFLFDILSSWTRHKKLNVSLLLS